MSDMDGIGRSEEQPQRVVVGAGPKPISTFGKIGRSSFADHQPFEVVAVCLSSTERTTIQIELTSIALPTKSRWLCHRLPSCDCS